MTKQPTTWDGLPASDVPPFGAAVVAYSRVDGSIEVLLLHRAHHGPDYDGDWAWTPPTGCRFPDEPIHDCALRELYEECGLQAAIDFTNYGDNDYPMYTVEVPRDAPVELIDPEHDRFEWVTTEEAIRRCEPEIIKKPLHRALAALEEIFAS